MTNEWPYSIRYSYLSLWGPVADFIMVFILLSNVNIQCQNASVFGIVTRDHALAGVGLTGTLKWQSISSKSSRAIRFIKRELWKKIYHSFHILVRILRTVPRSSPMFHLLLRYLLWRRTSFLRTTLMCGLSIPMSFSSYRFLLNQVLVSAPSCASSKHYVSFGVMLLPLIFGSLLQLCTLAAWMISQNVLICYDSGQASFQDKFIPLLSIQLGSNWTLVSACSDLHVVKRYKWKHTKWYLSPDVRDRRFPQLTFTINNFKWN